MLVAIHYCTTNSAVLLAADGADGATPSPPPLLLLLQPLLMGVLQLIVILWKIHPNIHLVLLFALADVII